MYQVVRFRLEYSGAASFDRNHPTPNQPHSVP